MGTERERKLAESIREGSRKTEVARQRGHAKRIKTRPWKALAEDWCEEMWRVFGQDVTLTPWTVKEQQLSRKLLREVEYETAVEMMQLFLRSWNEPGMPEFAFFWLRRGSVLAMIKRQVKKAKKRRLGEYDEESFSRQPEIGWGGSQDERVTKLLLDD